MTQFPTAGGVQSQFPLAEDVASYGGLVNALAQVGSLPATLTVSGQQVVGSNVTVPSTVTLRFTHAGQLLPATGITITINGSIDAPDIQIFGGAGTVLLGATAVAGKRIMADWFGTKPDGVTDSTPGANATYAAVSGAAGGEIVFSKGDYLFNGRVVWPNSSANQNIGTAYGQQAGFRIHGSAYSFTGKVGTRFLCAYQSPNPTSTTANGPGNAAGALSVAITGFGATIPQGRIGIGTNLTVTDGTNLDNATITAVTYSGGNVSSVTVDTLQYAYGSGTGNITISWPLVDDAKFVTLGGGEIEIDHIYFQQTTAGDQTPFILNTITRPDYHHNAFVGITPCTNYPGSHHSNQWASGLGIVLGGVGTPSGTQDASMVSGYAGYGGEIYRNTFSALEAAIVSGYDVTTTTIRNNNVLSNCGSKRGLAAVDIGGDSAPQSNAIMIFGNGWEICNYQSCIRFRPGNTGHQVLGQEYPDPINGGYTSGASSAGAATLATTFYFPTTGLTSWLKGYYFALDSELATELVQFSAYTAAQSTYLTAIANPGDKTITVNSTTGMSVGSGGNAIGLLLDPVAVNGTFGGAPGATGIQEPVLITGIAGSIITLAQPLAYKHLAGSAGTQNCQVGPFTMTVANSKDPVTDVTTVGALSKAHSQVYLQPCNSGVRFDKGASASVVVGGASNAAMLVRDLDGRNVKIGAQQATGATTFNAPVRLTSTTELNGATTVGSAGTFKSLSYAFLGGISSAGAFVNGAGNNLIIGHTAAGDQSAIGAYTGGGQTFFGFFCGHGTTSSTLQYPGVNTSTVTLGSPSAGTFTLTVGAQTTSGIAFNATAATVQAALQALSTVGTGNATATGSAGGPYTVTLLVSAPLTGSGAGLTGGTFSIAVPANSVNAAGVLSMDTAGTLTWKTAPAGPQGQNFTPTQRWALDINGNETVAGSTKSAGRKVSITSKSGNYTATANDEVILVAAASITVTLPAPATAGAGTVITVKNNNQTTTGVKTNTAGVLIDGVDCSSTAYTTGLTTSFGVVRLVTDSTNWFTV